MIKAKPLDARTKLTPNFYNLNREEQSFLHLSLRCLLIPHDEHLAE